VNPKLFSRIARFDQTMKLKSTHPNKDWLEIALEIGYYDYQHMARDFKEFTKQSPLEFFRAEKGAPERSFGHSETTGILKNVHSVR
jgi:AraC-like DNA-binding protein